MSNCLIFLKYISDAFEELYAKLKAEEINGTDPEDIDEYNRLSYEDSITVYTI